MQPSRIPYIPESAPFTAEQRAWLNGFLAGLLAPLRAEVPQPDPAPDAPSGEPLLILFGSQTGAAEALAKKLAKQSAARGFAPSVFALNDYEKSGLLQARRLLIVTSTWGDGDPPDNAAQFWSWLSAPSAPRLDHLEFGVLGLGDKNYLNFCGASRKFDARLAELGARRLAPLGECDVDYESAAQHWMDQLWPQLPLSTAASALAPSPARNGHPATNGSPHLSVSAKVEAPPPKFDKTNPFPAPLLRNVLLNRPGSGKEVRHYEFSLAGSGLDYSAGDALGVLPRNSPELVESFLSAAQCSGDEPVAVAQLSLSFRDALTRCFDITKPSTELLSAFAQAQPNCEWAPLLAPGRAPELRQWLRGRDVIDLLLSVGQPWPAAQLARLLRKLAPRLYSISSSPLAHPGEVHLTVGTVRYESFGRARKGVCSGFLADQCETAEVFVQASHGFKPPKDPAAAMIMVGPGTGIAPFRAFLEERAAIGAPGRHWLFFGDQSRACDFLYEDQLSAWAKSGHLTRLDLAFSRDQPDKIYVQHRMLERAPELWAWLEEGAHFYVCGDASRMAGDVDAALREIIVRAGSKSPDQAQAYVAALKSANRYQRDVY